MFKKKKLEDAFKFNWGVQSEILDIKRSFKSVIGVDAGGTKTLVSHVDGSLVSKNRQVSPRDVSGLERYSNNDYSSLIDILRHYTVKYNLSTQGSVICVAGAGPVAGPPEKRYIQLSNRAWNIRADEIKRNSAAEKVLLINDLEAMIYAVDSIQPGDIAVLNNVHKSEAGPVAVIAAGTGLGESCGVYVPERSARLAIAGEGGNSDFAPGNDLELELYSYLKNINGYVSWEDVLSGKGLVNIFQFLKQKEHEIPSQDAPNPAAVFWTNITPEEITEAGTAGTDAASRKALEIFVSLYGAEAGNLALKFLPEGGLYISGGIVPKILPFFHDRNKSGEKLFMQRFLAKGRLKPVLEKIPVAMITNPDYGVIGALNYALMHV